MTAQESQTKNREGPRPLPLHLMISAATLMSSVAAWRRWRSGSMDWHPALREAADRLSARTAGLDPAAVEIELGRAALARFSTFVEGIRAYRGHPYRRPEDGGAECWRAGAARLYRFGAGKGQAVLVVPSLINRSYVLDLTPERSLMRFLQAQGYRPYLLDWGAPDETERGFDLTDYLLYRLVPAFEAVLADAGPKIAVVGYCMGGTLTLPLVQQARASVAGLALLAAPWDFHAAQPALAKATALSLSAAMPVYERLGVMPVDALQALFASIDPHLALRKFTRFAALDPDSDAARHFVALEDWLNDGVPLAAPVARECLIGWYGDNTPARGEWRVAGEVVDPAQIDLPVLALTPAKDRLVPLASSTALAEALPNAEQRIPDAGHIGMITGSRARRGVWEPLADWLGSLAA